MGFPLLSANGGRKVIIYTTDGGGERPIHGAYWGGEKWEWIPCSWTKTGYHIRERLPSELDITKVIIDGKIAGKGQPRIQEPVRAIGRADFEKGKD